MSINHHVYRRALPSKDISMFGTNKIRVIQTQTQTRKPRITIEAYCDFTDIQPLNLGNNGGRSKSKTRTFSNISPERLVKRSKELRCSRIFTRQIQSSTEQETILIPIDLRHKALPKIKSPRPKVNQPIISKIKCPLTSSNTQPLHMSYNGYSKKMNNNNNINIIRFHKIKEDNENIQSAIDEEYVKKAIAKCAHWLVHYVPDKKYEENDEQFLF